MTEHITRIQFSPSRVTIYSDAGVAAIWTGKPYRVFSRFIVEAVKQVTKHIEEERHAVQIEGSGSEVSCGPEVEEVHGGIRCGDELQEAPEEGAEEEAVAPI